MYSKIMMSKKFSPWKFACSNRYAHYWLIKFIPEVANRQTEGKIPIHTLYQIVCGIRRFIEEKNENLDFNPQGALI